MRKLIGKHSYYKSLSNNLKWKNSLVSRLYECGQEAQHDNDRLRMINQGGVEMSMGRDPY